MEDVSPLSSEEIKTIDTLDLTELDVDSQQLAETAAAFELRGIAREAWQGAREPVGIDLDIIREAALEIQDGAKQVARRVRLTYLAARCFIDSVRMLPPER